MSEEFDIEDELGNTDDLDITFDDAPPQVKPTVAPVASAPKPKKARKPVAKSAAATATKRIVAKHRVDTIDNNKLAAYLDNLVNVEGYELVSVAGSTSMMGAFTIVSVKKG